MNERANHQLPSLLKMAPQRAPGFRRLHSPDLLRSAILSGITWQTRAGRHTPRAMRLLDPIEWPDEVEILIDRLEQSSSQRPLTREERALLDVYETVAILESDDCLHEFWQSGIDHQRIIKSFDLIGASSLVDPLNASRWCSTRPEDRNDYSETEAEYLNSIEEELEAGIDELVDLVMEFIEEEIQ